MLNAELSRRHTYRLQNAVSELLDDRVYFRLFWHSQTNLQKAFGPGLDRHCNEACPTAENMVC